MLAKRLPLTLPLLLTLVLLILSCTASANTPPPTPTAAQVQPPESNSPAADQFLAFLTSLEPQTIWTLGQGALPPNLKVDSIIYPPIRHPVRA